MTPAISIHPWRWRLSSTLATNDSLLPVESLANAGLPPTVAHRGDRRSARRLFPDAVRPRPHRSGPRNCTRATWLLSSRPEIPALHAGKIQGGVGSSAVAHLLHVWHLPERTPATCCVVIKYYSKQDAKQAVELTWKWEQLMWLMH